MSCRRGQLIQGDIEFEEDDNLEEKQAEPEKTEEEKKLEEWQRSEKKIAKHRRKEARLHERARKNPSKSAPVTIKGIGKLEGFCFTSPGFCDIVSHWK